MAERTLSPRLADIVEAIEHIRHVVDGISLEAFENDWQKKWLVERGVEIISEASRHLSESMKIRYPEIPWRKVAGTGNVVRHDYERVEPDILWKLAHDDLPLLERVCREELAAEQSREDQL
jgi:uncharacterized protein with HEPN domain